MSNEQDGSGPSSHFTHAAVHVRRNSKKDLTAFSDQRSRAFWREHFPLTTFWKVARGRLVPTVEVDVLPQSLVRSGSVECLP